MALSTMISMGACAPVNHKTAKAVCQVLEERYGEPFVATQIGDRWPKKTAKLYLHPQSREEIVFEAVTDLDYQVTDNYVEQIVLHEIYSRIQESFGREGMRAALSGSITEETVETDTTITPNEFVKKHHVEGILIMLAMDETSFVPDKVLPALESACAEYDFELVIYGYVLDSQAFENCSARMKANPYVGATVIESLKPSVQFLTSVINGQSSLQELPGSEEGK